MNELGTMYSIENIHKMAEYLSDILGKSIIIENKNFELIAYSSPDDFLFDSTQQQTILSKKCPIFIIERLEKEGIVKQLESSDPIRIDPIKEVGLYQRVVISVKHRHQTIGYIWVQESNNLLKKEELTLLKEISEHVGRLIYHNYSKDIIADDKNNRLLWRLVNHDYVNGSLIHNEANIASFILPDRFVILVISITDSTQGIILKNIKYLIENFQGFQTNSYLEKECKIIVVIGSQKSMRGEATKKAHDLLDFLKAQKVLQENSDILTFGIGSEYEQLREMRKSFLQALEVIEIAAIVSRTIAVPVEFSKLGMYRYLMVLYEKNSCEGFINFDLLSLQQKDEDSNSKLLQTLECFLSNNCKVKRTAEKLFIHPNTLNYRIKQIKKITEINFDDFNMNSLMYTELLLLNNVEEYYRRYKEVATRYMKSEIT